MERFDWKARGIWTAMSIALTLAATTAYASAEHAKKHSPASHKAKHHSKPRIANDPFRLPTEYWIKTGHIRRPLKPAPLHLPPVAVVPLTEINDYPPKNATPKTKTPAFDRRAQRRMAGVVFTNNGVYAVLQTGRDVQMVQPGDRVNGGKVISIESDGLTIRTDNQQMIRVPLASSNEVERTYTDPSAPGADPYGERQGNMRVGSPDSLSMVKPDVMFQ